MRGQMGGIIGRGAMVAAIALLLATPARAAGIGLVAGREAFDRGDYAAAAAAWRPLAEKGDPEAELGLGEVNEQGTGDYRHAEFWYEKAAGHSIEARYRLALIALAGNKNTPPDFVKAYKWALLADEPQNAWGRLADDLLRMLKQHLSAKDEAEGRHEAAQWRALQPPQPPPQPKAPRNPLPEFRKALKGIDCASLHVEAAAPGQPPSGASTLAAAALTAPDKVVITGTVPNEAARARVVELASRLLPQRHPELHLDMLRPPLCRSWLALAAIGATTSAAGGFKVVVNGGAPLLHEGQPISIAVWAGAYPVHLRIDYFSLDGRVLHMLPASGVPPASLAAHGHRVFGSGTWEVGSAPFGTEFISVLATPQPLDLGKRPEVEQAADYITALGAALHRAQASQPDQLATVLVHTAAR